MALVVVTAGIVAMLVALLSGSSSPNDGSAASKKDKAIQPVPPINPNDKNAGSADNIDPLDQKDDPFAASFGKEAKHKVVVRVSANGPGGVSVRYNDGRSVKELFRGSYSATRTFRSRFPTVGVIAQIIPPASSGTCTVIVDGQRVSRDTTNKAWNYVNCGG